MEKKGQRWFDDGSFDLSMPAVNIRKPLSLFGQLLLEHRHPYASFCPPLISRERQMLGIDLWSAASCEVGKTSLMLLCVPAKIICPSLIDFWFCCSFLKKQPFARALLFYSLAHWRLFHAAADANSLGQASYLLSLGWFIMPSGAGAQYAHLGWQLCESGSDHPRYLRSVRGR